MAHGKPSRRTQRNPHAPSPATNACGKVAHATRRDARRVASQYPADRLRPYRCPGCGWWHLGHLPAVVRHGHATTADIYRPRP